MAFATTSILIKFGVLTDNPGTLNNDFFEGTDLASGEVKWTGSTVDVVFGSNSQLRATAGVNTCDDSKETFLKDFIAVWGKVMNLDRFDPPRVGPLRLIKTPVSSLIGVFRSQISQFRIVIIADEGFYINLGGVCCAWAFEWAVTWRCEK